MVLGASVMDCVAYVERMPVKGETILGADFKMGFGGKGANQAVMAGILGDSTAMITKVNPNDAFGKEMKQNFLDNGVSVDHGAPLRCPASLSSADALTVSFDATVLETDAAPTGASAIHVDADGNNQIAVVMGANNELTVHTHTNTHKHTHVHREKEKTHTHTHRRIEKERPQRCPWWC